MRYAAALLARKRTVENMRELARTNDIVLISVVSAIFESENIAYLIADQFMSVLEGSTGFMLRRIMVVEDDLPQARRLLEEAGLMAELSHG